MRRVFPATPLSALATANSTLTGQTYLDHAGTTVYPASLIRRFSADLTSQLYGNPHSGSPAALKSARRVEDIRHAALSFFGADPDDFDLVFVANATAGAKLVAEAFRDAPGGFWYGHHRDCHTSLVGIREWATRGRKCLDSDDKFESWLKVVDKGDVTPSDDESTEEDGLDLFCYPAQSNMNGRRLPRKWCSQIRSSGPGRYTLLDAAAYVSTTPLHLGDADHAPDFTILSFNKTFGFPNLGAVIVRKDSAHVLLQRKYFGGGTTDMVLCLDDQWHAKKRSSIHAALEDGTLPFHNILALGHAMTIHQELFQGIDKVSRHATLLAARLYNDLIRLRHANGRRVVRVFKDPESTYGDSATQGPNIAFHMQNCEGVLVNNSEVEKLASISNIHIRTGGLCNPGGMTQALALSARELRDNYTAGFKCSQGGNLASGRPAGMIRVSLGATSTVADLDTFMSFLKEFFVAALPPQACPLTPPSTTDSDLYIESLAIYPIKSCGAFAIPPCTSWPVGPSGLAHDREWCLVHASTGAAISQKQHPQMALLHPTLDLDANTLRVHYAGAPKHPSQPTSITIPLSLDPHLYHPHPFENTILDHTVHALRHADPAIAAFFTATLGVPLHLARLPTPASSLANESPLLTITRASLNALNLDIKARGAKAVPAARFRPNIVLAARRPGAEQAWAEDDWARLALGPERLPLRMGDACRRCGVVCVDPATGERGREPLAALARLRRRAAGVVFGRHSAVEGCGTVRVGMDVAVGLRGWEADGEGAAG